MPTAVPAPTLHHAPPSALTGHSLSVVGLTVAAALGFMHATGLVGGWALLVMATFVLLAYLGGEMLLLRRETPAGVPWLLSPVSIASLYTLGFSFAVTNALFFMEGYAERAVGARFTVSSWLALAVIYALVAACGMWAGFRSGAGRALGQMLQRSRLLARVLRTSYEPNWPFFWAAVVLGTAARIVLVQMGQYGVLGDAKSEGFAFKQVLNYGGDLGTLSLLMIALHVYSQPAPRLYHRLILLGVIVVECIWGVVAADKSHTVMPLVLSFIVYYLTRQKLSVRYAALAVVVLAAGFLVLMPLRNLSRGQDAFDTRDAVAIAQAAIVTANAEILAPTPDAIDTGNPLLSAIQRMNQTRTAAHALRHAHEHPEDPVPDRFALDIVLTPIYAVIPRAVWPDKPRPQDVGRWFYVDVLGGRSATTLAGTTNIGYLNFAGGLPFVFFGFLVAGIMQRGVHDRFLLAAGGGAAIVLIGLTGTLGVVPSYFASLFNAPVRILPLLLLAQFAAFRR